MERGAIGTRRGKMVVLDRGRLERLACECYHAVNKEFRRLLDLNSSGSAFKRDRPEHVAPPGSPAQANDMR